MRTGAQQMDYIHKEPSAFYWFGNTRFLYTNMDEAFGQPNQANAADTKAGNSATKSDQSEFQTTYIPCN